MADEKQKIMVEGKGGEGKLRRVARIAMEKLAEKMRKPQLEPVPVRSGRTIGIVGSAALLAALASGASGCGNKSPGLDLDGGQDAGPRREK